MSLKYSKKNVKDQIMTEARILNFHMGSAESIAEKVSERVDSWAKKRSVITEKDLNRVISKEIKKFNADLAYVYQNRGKII